MKPLIIFSFLLLAACKTSNIGQTEFHDFRNQVQEAIGNKEMAEEFKRDCELQKVEMSKDSFGFYLKCSRTARELRKEVIQKAYPLMK